MVGVFAVLRKGLKVCMVLLNKIENPKLISSSATKVLAYCDLRAICFRSQCSIILAAYCYCIGIHALWPVATEYCIVDEHMQSSHTSRLKDASPLSMFCRHGAQHPSARAQHSPSGCHEQHVLLTWQRLWGLLGYTDVHPSHDADVNAGVRSATHLIHTQYYTLAHPSGERKACAWLPSVLLVSICIIPVYNVRY